MPAAAQTGRLNSAVTDESRDRRRMGCQVWLWCWRDELRIDAADLSHLP